jgi:hypothetical protein
MAKYAQYVAEQDIACDFIDSVAMGNYNEMGLIDLGNNYTIEKQSGWMGGNAIAQQYGVSPLQIVGLAASIILVVILAIWSVSLHQSLAKLWRPRRGYRSDPLDDGDNLSRQDSRIAMGHTASNTSYYIA